MGNIQCYEVNVTRAPKLVQQYTVLDEPTTASGHCTEKVSKIRKAKQNKPHIWFRKKHTTPYGAELEAAAAGYLRLFKHHLFPKVRVQEGGVYVLSKAIEHFQDLQTYLAKGCDAETQTYLIEHGLPELLVLSLGVEDDDAHKENLGIDGRIDFGMCFYSITSSDELCGQRPYAFSSIPPEKRFLLTSENIDHFPILKNAKPYYWPTLKALTFASHAYSESDIQLFSALSENKSAIHHAYLQFFQEILMPDDAIASALAAYIPRGAVTKSGIPILNKVQEHMIAKKHHKKRIFLQSTKAMAWFESLSTTDIKSLFDEFNAYNQLKDADTCINIIEAELAYYLFCRDATHEKIQLWLANFSMFANDAQNAKIMQQTTQLAANCKMFLEKEIIRAADIALFIRNIETVFRSINGMAEFIQYDGVLGLHDHFDTICCLLKKYDYRASVVRDVNASAEVGFVSVFFVNVQNVVKEIGIWFCRSENHANIQRIFTRAREDYQNENGGLFSRAYSFFYADPFSELNHYAAEIMKANTPDEVCRIISQMVSLQTTGAQCVVKKFVTSIIHCFANQVISIKDVADRSRTYPCFSSFLLSQPNAQLSMEGETYLTQAFIAGITPQCELVEDDFATVHHTSDHFR